MDWQKIIGIIIKVASGLLIFVYIPWVIIHALKKHKDKDDKNKKE